MFRSLRYPPLVEAKWPFGDPTLSEADTASIRASVAESSAESPWGWGHTIEIGSFTAEGFLGTDYLSMVAAIDRLGWWPSSLSDLEIADVGCFSGGVTALLAARNAARVVAIDEIPEHAEQCRIVAKALSLENVEVRVGSAYSTPEIVGSESLDGIFLGGVLYHLSDMLSGLVTLRRALKPGGWLIIESNVDESESRSYANFGRFYAGMWWQPSVLAVRDLLTFAGFTDIRTEVYRRGRVVARAVNSGNEMPFRRGFPIEVEDIHDTELRTLDRTVMAPANRWTSRLRSGIREAATRLSETRRRTSE